VFCYAGRFDLAYYDRVIASGISVHDATFNVRDRPFQQWGSSDTFSVAAAIKSVLIL
jgi:hypothetical protein